MLLRNKDKERLLAIFSSVDFPFEVWAYGSRVTGNAHEGSDLDLAVRSHNLLPLPQKIILGIKEKIQYSNIPIVVEIFDWARLPQSFQRNIEAQHEELFSSLVSSAHEPRAEYKKNDEKKT
jgi:predicted nucleotidyltransferase